MNTFWAVFTGTLAAGWGATAVYAEYRRRRRARRRERYLEGLCFLLDDKPERALEVVLGLAANADETIDTHFALGSLYRRRGEVDRAIRVHQHLVDRPGIDPRHRDAAMTELARDYIRAGLYDRAEKLLLQLAPGEHRRPTADFGRLGHDRDGRGNQGSARTSPAPHGNGPARRHNDGIGALRAVG